MKRSIHGRIGLDVSRASAEVIVGLSLVLGTDGDDSLTGTVDDDTLDGGLGADTMVGGLGNDTYRVDNVDDAVTEDVDQGSDSVISSVDFTLANEVENLTLVGAALAGTGNALDNRIVGTDGRNRIDGDHGADTMTGGAGDDTYYVDDAADVVVELADGGIDTVRSRISDALGDHVERLVLTGTKALNGIGNALDNRLTGNGASNMLDGGDGNDTIDGGQGADTMLGGTGDDRYTVDDAGDVVTEAVGGGHDVVLAGISAVLSAQVEDLILTGSADLDATGNESANQLLGNVGRNLLLGLDGDDTLRGAGGTDTMIGGNGDDTYAVVRAGDVIVEAEGGGRDTVFTAIDHVLGSEVEILVLGGTDSLRGTGNGLANILIGNSGVNVLSGLDGDDRATFTLGSFDGGVGDDTATIDRLGSADTTGTGWFAGGVAIDSNVGRARLGDFLVQAADRLGFSANDLGPQFTLTNVENVNILAGSSANDLLFVRGNGTEYHGGTGVDTFYADWGSAVSAITWVNTPTVVQTVNGVNVSGLERLILTTGAGNDRIDNSANASHDDIVSGAGDDTIVGGLGSDQIDAGAGDDSIAGNFSGALQVIGGDGDDTLTMFHRGFFGGGAGIDSTTIDRLGADETTFTGWFGHGFVNWASGRSSIASFFAPDLEFRTSDVGVLFTLSSVENLNVLAGSRANDLVFVLGNGTEYHGGAGTDTFYADWGTAASAIAWVNTPARIQTVHGVHVSGFERLIVTTGAGSDLVDNSAQATHDDIATGAGDDTLVGGAGSDLLAGGLGSDSFQFDSLSGTDTITDFVSGTDKIGISQALLAVGDGDHEVEAAVVASGPGGFDAAAELVIVTKDVGGAEVAAHAADAIGSATGHYAVGQTAIFALDDGTQSCLYFFRSGDADARVTAGELTLLTQLAATPSTDLGDYLFVP